MNVRALLTATALASCLAALTAPAMAAEPESCKNIHMADVGWTDNTAQNGLFNNVVKGLGYNTKIDVLALPVILESLKSGKLDLFLDNWMPSNQPGLQPYLDAKSLESLKPDLKDARYGPVVPDYVAAAGIKDIKDLAPNGDKFGNKFYGIEPGNDGNKIVQKAIDSGSLKGWKLVESSEQGMLVEANKDIAAKKWVVFLGWEPHPVMAKMPLVYLTGLESDGFGSSNVNPLTRNGYSAQCPNIGKLLSNLEFTIPMESTVMEDVGAPNNMSGDDAGKKWLKANPDVLAKWLDGVTAVDGSDGQAAVKKYLGL
jgi:glycine betaine/proline transport system substrate-binding protein